MTNDASSLRQWVSFHKVLADESRLRILMLLHGKELCLCHLCDVLGLAPSTVSKHVSMLVHAGFVSVRKDGRWSYFRLKTEESAPHHRQLSWMHHALEGNALILHDQILLEEVIRYHDMEGTGCQARTFECQHSRTATEIEGDSCIRNIIE